MLYEAASGSRLIPSTMHRRMAQPHRCAGLLVAPGALSAPASCLRRGGMQGLFCAMARVTPFLFIAEIPTSEPTDRSGLQLFTSDTTKRRRAPHRRPCCIRLLHQNSALNGFFAFGCRIYAPISHRCCGSCVFGSRRVFRLVPHPRYLVLARKPLLVDQRHFLTVRRENACLFLLHQGIVGSLVDRMLPPDFQQCQEGFPR